MYDRPVASNAITTAFTKKNAVSKLLKNAIISEMSDNGGVYYWNKKRALQLLNTIGVQFPVSSKVADGSIRSINDPLSKVKTKYKTVIETPQFKRWFKGSKIVNDDGTPKVLYHGTDAEFEAFDPSKGRSTMDIQGMFFSPWEIDAAGYGKNVGAYYLNLKNPALWSLYLMC